MILPGLLILISAHYLLASSVGQRRVGCENKPCEHVCVDTVDSYHCECFKNWVLQPDRHSCLHMRKDSTDSLYLGCFLEDTSDPDFSRLMWTRANDTSVEECIHSCRAEGHIVAGLRNGNQCYCSRSHFRTHGEASTCNIPCSGSRAQVCGGTDANSVYKVTRDNRYMGCYNEDVNNPDLSEIMWDEDTPASVDTCIVTCSQNGFLYAGVFNGGRCTCGNDFGSYGYAGEMNCALYSCRHGWKEQNCGGNITNAIYRVIKGEYIGSLEDAARDEPAARAEIKASIVSEYPHQQGVYARRFGMYANDVVHAHIEDVHCYGQDCYAPCGNIAKPDGFDRYNEDVVVRKYHMYLQDLHAEIDQENPPQRVWLYAQTVVINTQVSFEFSLMIRARQIIIDYNVDPSIIFNHEGPELGIDIENAIHKGPPSDLTFQKQSWLCARILLDRQEDYYQRLGWAIFDDLARERYYNAEQKDWLDALRAMKIQYTGALSDGVHFAPYYSKKFLEDILDAYYDNIGAYDDKYQELLQTAEDCIQFEERATDLLGIWTDSLVAQALIIKQLTQSAMNASEETYNRMYAEYNKSRDELEVARQNFEEGIKQWAKENVRKAMFGFIGDCYNAFAGNLPIDGKATVIAILETAAQISKDLLQAWEDCLQNIAAAVKGMAEMMILVAKMMRGIKDLEDVDWDQFEGSVEAVAGLLAAAEDWEVMRYTGDVLLDDPEFRGIDGCLEYQMAFFDTCNWGEAVTRSAVEHAENMRTAIAADALYANKKKMEERIQAELDALGDTCENDAQVVIAFAEQHYDIMLDANDLLVTFCQAHFYEKHESCPPETLPKFEGDLRTLQTAINQAKLITSGYSRQSRGNISVTIEDYANTTADCKDWKTCPMKLFKENRELVFELPIDHHRFEGIDLFLVEEVILSFPGVTTSGNPKFRLKIDVSGDFANKKQGVVNRFLSRPMDGMLFQYDIDTGIVELHCDLYPDDAGSSNIHQMSPFTTWIIRIEDSYNPDIDISNVQTATMILQGPFLNYKKDQVNQDH